MNRQTLIAQLNEYRSFSREEEAHRLQLLKLIREEKDCFQRHLLQGHVTGSAFIISPDTSQVLLLHHRKLNKWLQPGGHADGDENIARVAEREALEETGLQSLRLLHPLVFDLDIHTIPARKHEPEHLHYDIRYLFVANPAEPLQINNESKALAWFPLEQVPERCGHNTSICRMLEKIQLPSKHIHREQAG